MIEPEAIIDCNCLFGHWPRGELDASLATVLALLGAAGIGGAVVGSLRAALGDNAAGNEEALAACAARTELEPCAGLNLWRVLDYEAEVEAVRGMGCRLLRVFREYEGWPVDYAPFAQLVRAAGERGLLVMVAALTPGDITAMGRALADTAAALVVTGVNISHTPLVAEAIAVARDSPRMYFETSRLENEETLELLAGEVGGAPCLRHGAPLPVREQRSGRGKGLRAEPRGGGGGAWRERKAADGSDHGPIKEERGRSSPRHHLARHGRWTCTLTYTPSRCRSRA